MKVNYKNNRCINSKNGNLNIDEIFKNLSKLGLTSVLVEGGGKIATSLLS